MYTLQMTKLLEWLSCATVIFSIWLATITSSSTFVKEWHELILFLPIICLFIFGLYAATVVLYRVFTFNTCDSAAIELQQVSFISIKKYISTLIELISTYYHFLFQQIEEATKDLRSKGVVLRETST